jgi:hypothetical protein
MSDDSADTPIPATGPAPGGRRSGRRPAAADTGCAPASTPARSAGIGPQRREGGRPGPPRHRGRPPPRSPPRRDAATARQDHILMIVLSGVLRRAETRRAHDHAKCARARWGGRAPRWLPGTSMSPRRCDVVSPARSAACCGSRRRRAANGRVERPSTSGGADCHQTCNHNGNGRTALTGGPAVRAAHSGGGWGIRTPEGVNPTRFPSVRHRPLGESSVSKHSRVARAVDDGTTLTLGPRAASIL